MYFFKKELPNCEHCGVVIDRDVNAAINIKNRAVGHSVLKARRV
jgi:putative transposase